MPLFAKLRFVQRSKRALTGSFLDTGHDKSNPRKKGLPY